MNIARINFLTFNNSDYVRQNLTTSFVSNTFGLNFLGKKKETVRDEFVHSTVATQPIDIEKISDNQPFNLKFTKNFFKKLVREGVPDAYSDITLVPLEDVDILKKLGVLNHRSSEAIGYLKTYKEDMFKTEKDVFQMLEKLSRKHPEMNLQELLKLKYSQAEQALIQRQAQVLNKISLKSRQLPKDEYKQVRALINSYFDKIFTQDPLPEDRFKRKDFIYDLKRIKISDEKMRAKILQEVENLPNSANSINAFIVKYSQPYYFSYNAKNGSKILHKRTPEDIGVRLLMPSVGTDDHIYPNSEYVKEAAARDKNEDWATDLSDYKVTILASKMMNEQKTNTSLDDFATVVGRDDMSRLLQAHIDKLIKIDNKWMENGRYSDASTLADYILILKNEIEARSEYIKIDIGDFPKHIPMIKTKAAECVEKKRIKRLKKSGHADNTHREKQTDIFEKTVQNRKTHKHGARFNG